MLIRTNPSGQKDLQKDLFIQDGLMSGLPCVELLSPFYSTYEINAF